MSTRHRVSPDTLKGGSGKALANGTGDHQDQGHKVDLLSTQVVTADTERYLRMTYNVNDRSDNLVTSYISSPPTGAGGLRPQEQTYRGSYES